jgi:putative SOS response-associated peptidase YedK
MCGRFTLRTPPSQLVKQFGLTAMPELAPRYNIAPTQEVVAVRAAADGQSSSQSGKHAPRAVAAEGTRSVPSTDSARELVMLHWGLIPPWADDPRVGNRSINARSETADSKPAFREPFRQRRCLVVADGFYEWKTAGRGKQPYYIRAADDRPFAFAGLWARWRRGDLRIESCTILTTDANQRLADLHDRMPVILQPRDYDLWLDTAVQEVSRLKRLLIPCPDEMLTLHPVGTNVNRPSNDGPECIVPSEAQAMLPGFR